MADARSIFTWVLILVIAVMVVGYYTFMETFKTGADHFAEKFGPNEITCSLCTGINTPSCDAIYIPCRALPLMNRGEPYGANLNISNFAG
jgi:hypothetical protein